MIRQRGKNILIYERFRNAAQTAIHRRVAVKRQEGIEPNIIASLEAEAPLSFTIYGREKRRDLTAYFRTESNQKASKWVDVLRAAVRAANRVAYDRKISIAEEVTSDLVASIVGHVSKMHRVAY